MVEAGVEDPAAVVERGEVMYLIVYDDGNSLSLPMRADSKCEGAVTTAEEGQPILFGTKKEAERAVRVSRAWADLQAARGDSVDGDDFAPENRKHVKILKCKVWEEKE